MTCFQYLPLTGKRGPPAPGSGSPERMGGNAGSTGGGHIVTASSALHTGRHRAPKSKPDTQPREAGENSAS